MIIKELTDLEKIKDVLYHPDIKSLIGGDLISREDFNPKGDIQWLAGYMEDDIMGLVVYNVYESKTYCHIQVLPKFRKYTIKFLRMALKLGKAKNASLYAEIPKNRIEIINFAKAFNFKVLKDLKDTILMGLEPCQ